ncbi:MAG: hypothetical protein IJA32_04960 [Lachnospiraceae bacterium]|nr:hypothetical protein [Lachnospiraceae bacterium]
MKKLFNLMILTFYEFKLNRRLFAVNVVICGMLFGVMLAMTGLAFNIPKEMQDEILNSEFGEIQISNIDYKDIEYITKLPLEIEIIVYEMDWSMFEDSLNEKQKEINKSIDIDNSLNFLYYDNENTVGISMINKNLVSGEKWSKEDNEIKDVNPLWIEEKLAESMGLKVGDAISFSNSDCSVDFYVKGIYRDSEQEFAASYVSVKLYGTLQCEQGKSIMIRAGCNTSPYTFLSTIHTLKEDYFIVDSWEKNIYAMFLLIAFVGICTGLLLFITLSVVVDFIHIYLNLRQKFWAVNKALGLTDYDRRFICCSISFIVIVISYGLGMILSKVLSWYFTEYIETLFDFTDLNLIMTMEQFVMVLVCSLLLGFVILWNKKINVSSDIKG